MKEEYLWDKTGEDLEIQRLEEKLSVFRHQGGNAPALPIRSAANDERFSRWRFPFAFAFATGVAAVLLLVVWIQLSGDSAARDIIAAAEPLQSDTKPANVESDVPVNEMTNESQQASRNFSKQYSTRNRRPEPSALRQKWTAQRRAEKSGETATLTREEKFAYSQLMLALSITSSKLKIVKDTINGAEADKGAVTR